MTAAAHVTGVRLTRSLRKNGIGKVFVPVRQFCDSKGTTTNTFYQWRRRRRTETPARVNSDSPAYVSFQFAPSQLEIDLGDGVAVRVPNDCQFLRPILEVLRDLRTRSRSAL